MEEVTVEKYMTKSPVVIREEDSLSKAWEMLDTDAFHHLPVIDSTERVTGMLSATDIKNFRYLFSYMEKNSQSIKMNLTVADVMSTPAHVISKDETIEKANDLMLSKKVRALPVVKDGFVIGIISETDMLRYYSDKYKK